MEFGSLDGKEHNGVGLMEVSKILSIWDTFFDGTAQFARYHMMWKSCSGWKCALQQSSAYVISSLGSHLVEHSKTCFERLLPMAQKIGLSKKVVVSQWRYIKHQ